MCLSRSKKQCNDWFWFISLVLPHESVKLSATYFIQNIWKHALWFELSYSSDQINLIDNEHKAFIHTHRCELMIKCIVDSLSNSSSFKDGWSSFGARLSKFDRILRCSCNIFSYIQFYWVYLFNFALEKNLFSKRLSNFGLEWITQAKKIISPWNCLSIDKC